MKNDPIKKSKLYEFQEEYLKYKFENKKLFLISFTDYLLYQVYSQLFDLIKILDNKDYENGFDDEKGIKQILDTENEIDRVEKEYERLTK